ncbi:MAG: hypothetical protein C0424_05435 [Sphingobacteriaceae bacterium]|nr:hypothetical protein [Sphingobacteriaceae bacterium]
MISFLRCTSLCLLLAGNTFAQTLSLSTALLQFPPTNELGRDSLTFTITNTGSQAVQCRLSTFELYQHRPFWTPDSVFSLAGAGQRTIKVYFQPRHNILNNSELIIQHNGTGGSLRVDLRGQGTYSRAYYNATQDLEGNALRTALNTRTGSPYASLGYNTARIHMFHTIDNWKVNGRQPNHTELYKNECVYTGRTISYNSALSTGTLNNAPYTMNTEHTWPQSQGATNEPMQSDLHHLYVSDGPTNSARGNKPLRWVPNPTNTYMGGSKADPTNFEPRDVHKAGAAASILYFATRYYTNTSVNMGFLTAGQENDLREWLKLFPPDSVLRKRNDDIQSFQQNRNPYIDYPQLLDRMDQVRGAAAIPQLAGMYVSDTLVQLGQVASGAQAIYRVYVVNSGNQELQLSNVGTSGSGLATSAASTLSIPRGESALIELQFTGTGQNFAGALQFNTNIPGQASVNIPVFAGAGTGGVSLAPFALLSPFSGLELELSGDTSTVVTFRWQRTIGSNGNQPLYTFQLRDAGTQQAILTLPALNDTVLPLPFGFLSRQLQQAGNSVGSLVNTQWQVTATLGGGVQRISNDTRNLGLRLGVFSSVQQMESTIRLYPNPAQDALYIDGFSGNLVHIQVSNMLGQNMPVSMTTEGDRMQLGLQQLPAGRYLVQIQTTAGIVQSSFVKVY